MVIEKQENTHLGTRNGRENIIRYVHTLAWLVYRSEYHFSSLYLIIEHYNRVAAKYDAYFEKKSRMVANFVQRFLPLARDDQLVDIGGGTAKVSLAIQSDVGMTKPVVCVDPSQEMLEVAQKNGAITIQATAESFLASKPDYPLKVVFMNACIHHFKDLDFVLSKLAEYMPDGGMCVLVLNTITSVPMLMGDLISKLKSSEFQTLAESKGLKWKSESKAIVQEVEKALFYECIRQRYTTPLLQFSDEELEQGIQELEEMSKDQDKLHIEMMVEGIILTK